MKTFQVVFQRFCNTFQNMNKKSIFFCAWFVNKNGTTANNVEVLFEKRNV